MKFKFISILILTTAAITTTTSAIQAQFPPNQRQVFGREKRQLDINDLNLTDEQKGKIKEVQEQTKAAINQILTYEQTNTLKQAIAAGKKPPEAIQSINLSDEQKQKIWEVMQSHNQKIFEILTLEQQQKVRDSMVKQLHINAPERRFMHISY